MCARLEGDSSLVEEFELPLWLATTRNFGVAQCWRRRRSLRWLTFDSSPWLWRCSILLCELCALFVWWRCLLRRVMYNCFLLK